MMRGLYIHIPFCKRKCNYCDFASFAGQEQQIDAYLGALSREASLYKGMECNTLYVGGGTPSLLAEHQLRELGKIIRQNFCPITNFTESTFEANPESLTLQKAILLREMGFNRLSMGLQSFNNAELKILGRIHNADQFLQAYQAARDAGFQNINVDLMAGLPTQTLDSFLGSLQQLIKLHPEHISVYGLQIEEGTPFFERGVVCDQNLMRVMLEKTHLQLANAGYEHYEISNYALSGKRALHNTNYWQNGEYLGLGSAAASYCGGIRRQNVSSMSEYMACMKGGKAPIALSEQLTGKAKAGEALMLAFRQLDGIEPTPEQISFFGKEIEKHIQNGLLTRTQKKVKLSEEGLYLANEVMRSFVAPFEEL